MARSISILGCGWLGVPLAKALLQKDYSVQGSTTSISKLPLLSKEGIKAHLIEASKKLIGDTVDEFFNTQILIISIPPKRRNPDVFKQYPNIIHQIAKLSTQHKIPKIIYLSSTGIYAGLSGLINEQSQPIPQSESGKALLRAEHILRKQPQFKTTVLRLAGLYGPNRHPGKWFAGKTNIPDAKKPVNLVHQSDVIRLILEIIEQDSFGKIYNVCGDQHPERAIFYTAQSKAIDLEIPLFSNQKTAEAYPIIDNLIVKKELQFTFLESL